MKIYWELAELENEFFWVGHFDFFCFISLKKAARSFISALWMVFPESWKRSYPNFYTHNCTYCQYCQLGFSSKIEVQQLGSAWNLHSLARAGKFQREHITKNWAYMFNFVRYDHHYNFNWAEFLRTEMIAKIKCIYYTYVRCHFRTENYDPFWKFNNLGCYVLLGRSLYLILCNEFSSQ
jgi:hypothetical protein